MNVKIPEMNWVQDGENNGHPIWRLNVGDGDYVAKVANGYTLGWHAILNNAGLVNTDFDGVAGSAYSFDSEMKARERVEYVLTDVITERVEAAVDSVTRYTDFMIAQGKEKNEQSIGMD